PGPTLETCVGDTVTLNVTNKGTMAHGLDTHALRIDAGKFGPIDAGQTLAIAGTVSVPGVFMYHCAAGPMTDQHIKMGMAGVMIVYPRTPALPPALEIVVCATASTARRLTPGRSTPIRRQWNRTLRPSSSSTARSSTSRSPHMRGTVSGSTS